MPERHKNRSGSRGSTGIAVVTCVALLCGTAAFIAYLLIQQAEPRRLWQPVVLLADGTRGVIGESRRMDFWTPSAQTKDYLARKNGAIAPEDKWQALDSEEPVVDFGNILHSNQDVLGYRRSEVWGQGRTVYKPGWWWTVSVVSNYPVDDLAKIYRTYWKTPQPVRVEVIDNRGTAD